MNQYDNIVFFDGVCNMCNQSVNLLMKLDRRSVIKYSSLQGELAKDILQPEQVQIMSSLIYYSNGIVLTQSQAVVGILKQLGGIYGFIGVVFSLFPNRFLNLFYDLVAKNRYRLFGKSNQCRIPSEEEAALFLD